MSGPPRVVFRTILIVSVAVEICLAIQFHREISAFHAEILKEQGESDNKHKQLENVLAKNSALAAKLQLLKTGRPTQTTEEASVGHIQTRKFIDRFKAALADPVFQRLLAEKQNAALWSRYGGLFKKLGLDAADTAKIKDLIVQRQMAKTDALLAANDEGMTGANDSSGTLRAVIGDAQKDIDAQIHALLGDAKFAQYLHFEETDGIRATVGRIQQALSCTFTPLSDGQADKLTETWYQELPASRKGHTSGPSAEMAAGLLPERNSDEGAPIPGAGIESVRSFLSPQQLATVTHIMSFQQAQQRLEQMAASSDNK